jgi:phosphate transport system permease protein
MITLVCYRAPSGHRHRHPARGAHRRRDGAAAAHQLRQLGDVARPRQRHGEPALAIYQQANSGFPDLIAIAWSGALLVTLGVLAINIVARVLLRRRT